MRPRRGVPVALGPSPCDPASPHVHIYILDDFFSVYEIPLLHLYLIIGVFRGKLVS